MIPGIALFPSSAESLPERAPSGADPSGRGRLKFVLLALLVSGPRHGYDLKNEWESLLGDIWPLGPSQVYAALTQLERDGLVETEIVPQEPMPPRKVCRLTASGREAISSWLSDVVAVPQQLRDDFVIKVLLAMSPAVAAEFPPLEAIMRHRAGCVRSLKELQVTRETALDPTSRLLIEAAMIRIEGNLRWLDVCEEQLRA